MFKAITIDGPCASGKSTAARRLAKKLGFIHLNSGALYRAVGLAATEAGYAIDDDDSIAELARSMSYRFVLSDDNSTLLTVNDQDVSDRICSEQAGALASKVGVLPKVREVLTDVQRGVGKEASVVLEGRDAGTVVFPNAAFKFYLDADLEERVRRRFSELDAKRNGQSKDRELSIDAVREELQERDHRDSTRAVAPQVKAADALAVDTTKMSADEVVQHMYEIVAAS